MGRSEVQVQFTEEEAEFLLKGRLGRIATVSPKGQPHAVPVVYEFDGHYLYFGGWNLRQSLKFKNIEQNPRVAFVVDDLESTTPWRPRGIEVRGKAEIIEEDGDVYVRVTPLRKASWGLRRRENGTG
jgi:pyridoxamine 5'-phosphate oxidase family protein